MRHVIKNLLGLVFAITMPVLAMDCTTAKAEIRPKTEENQALWLKPGLLNSERIKMKFGSFNVIVLKQDLDEGYRLSNLRSGDNKEKASRTIAFTTYQRPMDERLIAAHKKIIQGGSIGSTLNEHGFQLRKNIFFKGTVSDMPIEMINLMPNNSGNYAALVYELSGEIDGKEYPYCTIAEVYSPEFLTLVDLDTIYRGNSAKASSGAAVTEGIAKTESSEKGELIFNQLRKLFKMLK